MSDAVAAGHDVDEDRDSEDDDLGSDAPRLAMQELPRPPVMDTGRMRLLEYPALAPDVVRVERMKLEMKSYPGSTALPIAGTDSSGQKSGAIYSRRGRVIRDSERAVGRRGGRWQSNQRNLHEELPAERIDVAGRSFFLGHWSPGFGHVLLEMIPRLWLRQDYTAYDNFVVYSRRYRSSPVMEPKVWLCDLLALCDIPFDRVVVVRAIPMNFLIIDVTTQPFVLKSVADPRFLDPFDAIRSRVLAAAGGSGDLPKRVYLSRSQLTKRAAVNEEDIERAMEREGFTVLHPQTLTIAEQIAILAQVEVIAGCDGSALHMAAFARPGTKLLALDARFVRSQILLDRARGLDAVHLFAVDQAVPRMAKWTADVQQVEQALDVLLRS